MNEYRISLSWPPLGPDANQRGNRALGYLRREAQRKAKEHCREAMNGVPLPPAPWTQAEATISFRLPTLRPLDLDNLGARCKPYLDQLVEAGVIVDDSWRCLRSLRYTATLDREAPGFEIVLSRV